jgi:4-hydroxybenzoate polyprenyltransferase
VILWCEQDCILLLNRQLTLEKIKRKCQVFYAFLSTRHQVIVAESIKPLITLLRHFIKKHTMDNLGSMRYSRQQRGVSRLFELPTIIFFPSRELPTTSKATMTESTSPTTESSYISHAKSALETVEGIPTQGFSQSPWVEKINAYERLMRLDKPIGIALLLFPTLIALWGASYRLPSALMVLLFVTGVVLMRSAGCVINDLWDRKFDGLVARTRDRPLPNDEVSVFEAILLATVLIMVAVGIVVKFNDPWAYGIAAVSMLITLVYPLMKRYIHAPQAVLGIAFSLGIPMAFAVLLPSFPTLCWMLFGLNFFYVVAYDTVYAMADREDDLRLGLKSTAIWLGKAEVALVMTCYTIYGLGMIATLYSHAWHQYLFLQCLAWVVFMIDQWLLIRTRDPFQCIRAFRRSFWLALVFWLSLLKWPIVLLG